MAIFINRQILVSQALILLLSSHQTALSKPFVDVGKSKITDSTKDYEWTHHPAQKGELSKVGLERKNAKDRTMSYEFMMIECNGREGQRVVFFDFSSEKKSARPKFVTMRGNGDHKFIRLNHEENEMEGGWDIEAKFEDLNRLAEVMESPSISVEISATKVLLPASNSAVSNFFKSCK